MSRGRRFATCPSMIEGFFKVIGIFSGCYESPFQKTNYGRRIDGTVINFVQQFSAL